MTSKLHHRTPSLLSIVMLLLASFWFASSVAAADPIKLSVPIGGTSTVANAGEYINIFYSYFLTIISGLAMFMVLLGGLRWITAAGNSSAIGSAKQMITSALIGLILAFTSVLILRFINIDLVDLSALDLPPITPVSPGGLFANTCPETENTRGADCGGTYIPKVGVECIAWKNTCTNPGEYCLPVGGGTQWKCSSFKTYCEIETSKDNCEVADSTILTMYHQVNDACAKDEVSFGLSRRCIWGSIIKCDDRSRFQAVDVDPLIVNPPGSLVDLARASCTSGDDDSECNDDGQPEDCEVSGVTMCTDKGRAVKGADCVCCKKIEDLACGTPACGGEQTKVSNDRCKAYGVGDCAALSKDCCAKLNRKL